ncbi:MAG: redox-regulated ATPase YchF, partial [Deltaproteobacteria bacterium]|nr:redox-regulated ATPase YchF [Deltaproteobacteria bacterium]
MKIGLVGLPNSGKTTIFNALTKSEAEVTSYASQKAEPHIAIIEVADERVDNLTQMYNPKKTTLATIEIVDFVGFSEGMSRNGGLPASFVTHVKTTDAIAMVVRNFGDNFDEAPNPLGDIDTILTEFILSDLIITENRLEKIEEAFRRGKKTVELEREKKILRMIEDTLNENRPVREIELTDEDKRIISGFQYLTQKQLLVIVNSSEANFSKNNALIGAIDERFSVIEFAGNFEMELSRLDDEEGALFMEDMGIEESARARLTRSAYELLGLISFLTVGTDEVRAWTIHSGDTALDAAGTIHSDLARGFIRAECFSYENLVECGSEKAVRDNGHFRLE